MDNLKGHFTVKKITRFDDLQEGQEIILPESDLCFQDSKSVYQFAYVEAKQETKYEIKPGVFSFNKTAMGLTLSKIELRGRELLESIINTSTILKEAKTFFSKLDVYERLSRPKKRGVLLYSAPGMGKSSAIEKFCADAIAEDPGTVVVQWPTSEVGPEDVSNFLSQRSEFTTECTRLILIIEDIGGQERDGEYGRAPITAGLLNLLDGIGVTFKLPTFIVATTNHPENLLSSLANRPGRFDLMVKFEPPSAEERVKLLKFVSKRDLTEEEEQAIVIKGTENFSIAHIEEVVVRSELHEKSYRKVIQELIDHAELFKTAFADKKGSMGFGSSDDF